MSFRSVSVRLSYSAAAENSFCCTLSGRAVGGGWVGGQRSIFQRHTSGGKSHRKRLPNAVIPWRRDSSSFFLPSLHIKLLTSLKMHESKCLKPRSQRDKTRSALSCWFHFVDLFWGFEEKISPVLIIKENMIAALSVNQYQIKYSEENMSNAHSFFLEPQKITTCLFLSLKSNLQYR